MARSDQESGFLSRWARLKAQARSGTTPQDGPAPEEPVAEPAVRVDPGPVPPVDVVTTDEPVAGVPAPETVDADPPPLTLPDVVQLTRDSDFSRFVAADVKSEVKNAAMKKLFSDPHFNVMDGLDVYIDDYNTPDPLPSGMLMKMAQAKFLGLVKDAAEELLADRPAPINHGTIQVEPACADMLPQADKIASDEDADLQLQPHDAAGRVDVDPGTGENGGCEH